MLSPELSLTSIPLMSRWGGEVSPNLDSNHLIGSPPFNIRHLKPRPDLPLTSKSSIDCLPQAPNQNHSCPPIDIIFDFSTVLVGPHESFWGPSCIFVQTIFWIPNSTYSPGICLKFSPAQCYGVIEPDPFHVQYHLSLIPCDQCSLAVHTYLRPPSKPVGTMRFLLKIIFILYYWIHCISVQTG